MSRYQVYIKPFDDNGNYQSEYIEVTDDVSSLGNIKKTIDADEYNTGIFKFSNLSLVLNDFTGKYSNVGNTTSIFRFKRTGSLVKITWSFGNDITQAGNAIAGESFTNYEQTLFIGILSDEATTTSIGDQKANFSVTSYDSILNETETNFSSLSNGQSVSTIIYTILNQTNITNLLTVDAGNINPQLDHNVDDVSGYENQVVFETLKDLLSQSNSVFYIDGTTVYVSDRTPTTSVQKNFYGQASDLGIENITNITGIRSGLNKVFNFISWDDTTLSARNTSSITNFGVRKKSVKFDSITNSTTQQNILNNIRDEFGTIKQELILTTPIDYTTITLDILDKVDIDYPTPFRPAEGESLPILGQAILGDAYLPIGEWSFTIGQSTKYKILEITFQIRQQQISYKLKEV